MRFSTPPLFPPPMASSELPPGLLQHVQTQVVPWASILVYGPLDIAWICCPQLPTTHAKTGRTAQVFTAQGGTRREF